ncbi:MAG: hypothetical protein LC747_03795 [Acidobacteria bacterium]|nr:hypothetical protein [Acidobacteriota bacterium]
MKAQPLVITPKLLGEWLLPQPEDDDDKEARGRVLVIGGSTEIAGAVVLAATAALRAGAGKMQIATCRSLAPHVSMAVPEARVIGLPETGAGGIAAGGLKQIEEELAGAQAVLVGPGMVDEAATARLMKNLLHRIPHATLVLDAGALAFLKHAPQSLTRLHGRVVLTPHAGEMASISGIEKDAIEAAPLDTSTPFQAAVWGVYLHARAGDELARRMGPLGFLARELLAEIPPLMAKLCRPKK